MSSQSAKYLLYNAIDRKTDVSEIEQLLKDGKSPNQSPPCCPPPLYRAVRFNRPDIALVLLRAGCQVTTSKRVEKFHSPIITIAASLNMTEVVLNLCANPECNVFAVDAQLRTIFHIAVVRRNYELLQGLLSCHRDNFHRFLTARDGLGLTPLHLAASVGDVRMVKLLLQLDEGSGSEQHPKPESHRTGGDSTVQGWHDHICSFGTQKTNWDESPASYCKKYAGSVERGTEQFPGQGYQKGTASLVDHPVLGSKETMLHLAARGHHIPMVQFLVSCGARVNSRDMMNNTPLHCFVSHGNADHRALAVVRLLLNAGADWSLKGTFEQISMKSSLRCPMVQSPQWHHRHKEVTVGMIAAIRNRVAYLKLLAGFGAQFGEVDALNMTTLMHALSHGSEEAARYLLLNHSEQDVFHTWTDRMGLTALHLVSFCRSKAGELAALMLDRGYGAVLRSDPLTDPSCLANSVTTPQWASRQQSFTPVTRAIVNEKLDVLRILVRHHPHCLQEGYTQVTHSPLHVTLRWIPDQQCMSVVDFLLAHGCDGNKVVCGQTAYEYAVTEGSRWEDDVVFSATYLKKKLGVVFREGGGCTGRSGCPEVWSLKDVCMERLRQVVREAKGSYFEAMSSLPLPQSVVGGLLFES